MSTLTDAKMPSLKDKLNEKEAAQKKTQEEEPEQSVEVKPNKKGRKPKKQVNEDEQND